MHKLVPNPWIFFPIKNPWINSIIFSSYPFSPHLRSLHVWLDSWISSCIRMLCLQVCDGERQCAAGDWPGPDKVSRASNEGLRRFHHHGEGLCWVLLLVGSASAKINFKLSTFNHKDLVGAFSVIMKLSRTLVWSSSNYWRIINVSIPNMIQRLQILCKQTKLQRFAAQSITDNCNEMRS